MSETLPPPNNPPRRRSKTRSGHDQWMLAKKALSMIFDGDMKILRTRGKLPQIQVARGTWRLEKIEDCLKYLEKSMRVGTSFEPLTFNNETAWIIVSRTLATQKLGPAALDVAYRYFDVCYRIQSETTQWIPKARVLSWLSDRLRDLDKIEIARGSMLLAYIEELMVNKSPSNSQAYSILQEIFDVSMETLHSLAKHVESVTEPPLFPEETLMQWELDNIPDLSELWSR